MKKVIGFLSLIFSLIFLFSCEPGRDTNGDLLFGIGESNENGGGAGKLKLLKKMTATDSDGAVTIFNYSYISGLLKSVAIDEEGNKSDISLTYNKDKIAQFVITEMEGSDIVKTTMNLTYSNGKLTSASGKMESAGVELTKNFTNFTYDLANGKLKQIITSLSSADPANPGNYVEIFKYVSALTFEGGNISNYKMTLTTNATPPIGIPPIVFDIKMSNYDQFKNPWATLPLEFNMVGAHFLSSTNSVHGLSINNYKTASVTNDGVAEVINYNYVYDAEGYPTAATATQGVLKFEYITL